MDRQLLLWIKLLLAIFLVFFIAAESFPQSAAAPGSVHEILAELSDEQVRQMLIVELQKEASSEALIDLKAGVSGPSAPFAQLLGSLENESALSGEQFKALWQGIPHLLPDLYKVLVSL
ncbi:MAG: hypothetical protein GY702_00895 [Desulfobulbaceae bacterium]|nr:hypothetical protein [Desulfobulbaceae bacterium]